MGDPGPARSDRPYWLIPAKDLPKHPPVDLTPLTDHELAELRDKLNRHDHTGFRTRHLEAWWHLTVVRDADSIAKLVATVRAGSERADQSGREYAAGILDAVAWALGELPTAPISLTAAEGPLPVVREMRAEAEAAREVMRRHQYTAARPYGYVVGVEACLMWLCADGADSPW